jgi:hypothetical protein
MRKFLLGLIALTMMAPSALAAQITITGTVSDPNGSAPFSITVTTDQVSITSAAVIPAVAAPGTMRTMTVVAVSSAGLPLTAAVPTCGACGITFTPVAGQPAGTFVWTFVY